MSRSYVKVESLAEEVFRRKTAGETNREIGEHFGLTKEQIKQLAIRQRRKQRMILNGYIPRPKGRPRKAETTEEMRKDNELSELRMQVELLRNFLSEVGLKRCVRCLGFLEAAIMRGVTDKEKNKDQWLVDLIAEIQTKSKQTYGCRRIRRWLKRKHNKTVNLKAYLRIMRKYALLSQVRRHRPYMRFQKALHKYSNELNREFN